MVRSAILSKSRFLAGLQCSLRLWNDIHHRELATPPGEDQQAIFDQGTRVGELARDVWPGGTLVGFQPWERQAALAETQRLMADPNVPAIYEAALIHQDVFVRVDILVRDGQDWDLVEVKASTRPEKEVFLEDIAVQHWVATGAGLNVGKAGILVLNRDYVYPGGDYDLDQLFTFFDATEHCLAAAERIGEQVKAFHHMLAETEPPDIPIGDHCFSPYECPYYAHCSRDTVFPDNPINNLHRLHPNRQAQLEALGIDRIEDIPDDFNLSEVQHRIRQAVLTQTPWQSGHLTQALKNVTWPLYYLDFEAFQPALPRYPGTRPFQAIPFQYSLHIETENGDLTHSEYLHTDNSDPRPALANALLEAIGTKGSIVVYSGYERRMLNDLATAIPELADQLQAATNRLWDLLPIIRNHYYHPDFKGSYSIKAVLPALVKGNDWSELTIADGMAAATAYEQALANPDSPEAQETFKALRDYCRMDTQAMVDLRHALRRYAD